MVYGSRGIEHYSKCSRILFQNHYTVAEQYSITECCQVAQTKKDRGLADLTREELIGLLQLPDHLRRTMTALIELGEASADMVARQTGRTRPTESDCLNQLVRLGYTKKRRKGLTVYFSVRKDV